MTSPMPASARVLRETPRYRRPSRLLRAGAFALGATGALGIACGGGGSDQQGQTASEWVQTDGAAGRINLDDVQKAYREAFTSDGFKIEKFTEDVNKIYEGDNLVLVQSERVGDQAIITGWEDLNADKKVEAAVDDKLFTITQDLKQNGQYVTQGNGANGYYHQSSFFEGFLPGLLLGSLFTGGRTTYVTPPVVYDTISSSRSSYRGSPDYRQQQERNASYGGSVGSRFGSDATSRPVSPARSSYQSRQVNSGGFRSSGSSTRSIGSGGKSGPSASGGLKGGGGLPAR